MKRDSYDSYHIYLPQIDHYLSSLGHDKNHTSPWKSAQFQCSNPIPRDRKHVVFDKVFKTLSLIVQAVHRQMTPPWVKWQNRQESLNVSMAFFKGKIFSKYSINEEDAEKEKDW